MRSVNTQPPSSNATTNRSVTTDNKNEINNKNKNGSKNLLRNAVFSSYRQRSGFPAVVEYSRSKAHPLLTTPQSSTRAVPATTTPTPNLSAANKRTSTSTRTSSTTSKTVTITGKPPPFVTPRLPRLPLCPKDRNQDALSRLRATPPTTTSTSTSTRSSSAKGAQPHKMPPGDSRPRQPQLSAAAAKVASRPPLTPKVAAKGSPAVSPLGRRAFNQTPTLAGSQAGFKEDFSTPPFLGNVTPRSGHRQSRVESTNSTPSGTPTADRSSDAWESGRGPWGVVPTLTHDSPKQTSPSDSSGDASDSKFFYASDARTGMLAQPPQQQRPASVPQKPATFFYANAVPTEGKRTTSPPSNPTLAPMLNPNNIPESASSGKFFYANGTPDGPPAARQGLPISASGSTVSSSSRLATARPGTSSSATGHIVPVTQRPASPVKAASTPTGEALRSSAMSAVSTNFPQVASPPPITAPFQPSVAGKRRVSIEAPPRIKGHLRSGSVPNPDAMAIPKLYSPFQNTSETSSPPSSPGISSQPTLSMASILQAVEDFAGDENEARDMDGQAEPQSPTKSIHSPEPISEMVANARRERKVQDLEITNASLEAINRTLERQLRKQTAELRRYRRLSRSGRLSIASLASSRVPSEALTEPPSGLSDVSEFEESDEEDEPDSLDDSDVSIPDSGSAADILSPNARAAARRKRDERRLQLDLTKHQELLVDSQKINQSIKRCLDWTEVLIKEGNKALQYNVRVSDVKLGGKVLSPADEEDEDDNEVHGLRAHGDEQTHEAIGLGLQQTPTKSPQDRDSGVEMPVDGG